VESEGIFPRVLVRIAGGDFGCLESLNLSTAEESYAVLECATEFRHRSEELSGLLERMIGEETDKKLRSDLIAARRSTLKGKAVDPAHFTGLDRSTLVRKLKEYREAQSRRDESQLCFENRYGSEVFRISKYLKGLGENEVLRKGLGLSSVSLLKGIENSYSKRDEKGLFKYVSRYCAKTTPYSTLTQLALGMVVDQVSICTSSYTDDSLAPVGHIRVNGSVLEWLLIHLTNDQEISQQLPIRLNPTLTVEGSNYLFLVNFRNIEAFQVLGAAPMLEFIRSLLAPLRKGLSFIELSHFVKNVSNASESDVLIYIRNLLNTGFIEFAIPISGIEPDWLHDLAEYMTNLKGTGKKLEELLIFLKNLLVGSQEFSKARSDERQRILNDVHSMIESFWQSAVELEQLTTNGEEALEPNEPRENKPEADAPLEEQNPEPEAEVPPSTSSKPLVLERPKPFTLKIKEESILYEDAAFPGSFQLSKAYFADKMELLAESLQKISALNQLNDSQDDLRAFFESRYADQSTVSLLSFYRDYYSRGNQQSIRSARQAKRTNNHKEVIDSILKEFEKSYSSSSQEYQLDLGGLPLPKVERRGLALSFAVFAQVAHAESDPRLFVINSIVPGYGKYVGRFLHLFDDTVTREFMEVNRSATDDGIMVENRDASFFNANVHPPLLPFEIWAPGSNTMLDSDSQVSVTDLVLKKSQGADGLEVWSQKLHCPVYVLDLGFQNPMARSQLFRLLSTLGPSQVGGFWPIINAINGKVNELPRKASPLILRPRIILQNKIVLQRKSWFLSKNLFPTRISSEPDQNYYLRIFDWWKHQKLPNEAFLRMYSQQHNNNQQANDPQANQEKTKPWRMDDRKPQYFNIMNPLSVNLLGDMLSRSASSLMIEEMLPRSDQLLPIGNERRVIEYVIHHYEYKKIL